MLILILIDVQYLQNAVFNFEKGLNRQNHSSHGSHHPVKNFPSKISDSPHPTPYYYLENPGKFYYNKRLSQNSHKKSLHPIE